MHGRARLQGDRPDGHPQVAAERAGDVPAVQASAEGIDRTGAGFRSDRQSERGVGGGIIRRLLRIRAAPRTEQHNRGQSEGPHDPFTSRTTLKPRP